jgi:short-subunit dehydrogenase involved in D-alanine esterification of teichoic acids
MGAKTVITGRNAARLRKTEADLAKSDNLLAVRADAVKTPDWKHLIAVMVQTFGCLNVLINNHEAVRVMKPCARGLIGTFPAHAPGTSGQTWPCTPR